MGWKRRTERLGVQIDVTPMVDIAFLLLTFFIITTTLKRHQSMEINLPPSHDYPVPETNVLTIQVKEDDTIYWNIGSENPQKIPLKDLMVLAIQSLKQNPRLMAMIKIDRRSRYEMMVDVIDELKLAQVDRISLVPMEYSNRATLQKASF